jgi:S-(hydroxymethyl)glutathione dehydrogenase/alcohol dehydrogenase
VKTSAALFKAVDAPFELADVELEEPYADDVAVRVDACGICGTDLHIVRGEWTRPVPMILGHECSGIVEEVGANATDLAVGDRVVVSWASACRACAACAKRRPAACPQLRTAIAAGTLVDGTTRLSRNGEQVYRMTSVGGFAERVVMPASSVLRLPDDLSLRHAATLGCAALTGVGAVTNASGLERGASVLVVGAGGIGQFVIQAARIAGAGEIVAVDPAAPRRALAHRLGATHAVAPSELDDVAGDLAPDGFDCTFDAVGGPPTAALAISHTTVAGRAVIVGLPPAGALGELDLSDLVVREKQVVGTIYGSADPADLLPTVLEWVRDGKLELESLITGTYPLAEIDAAVELSMTAETGGRVLVAP